MWKITGLCLALIPACALTLSACGGGGEDDTGLSFRAADVNGRSAILATGGAPPDVSPSEVKSQQLDIVNRFDSGHMSTQIEVFWDGSVQRTMGSCDPDWCWRVPELYRTSTFSPIMIRNGVRLARSTHTRSYSDGGVVTTLGYGGWMNHSVFTVHVQTITYDGGSYVDGVDGYSVALGDASESNRVTGRFVWYGVMVGRNSDIASAEVSNVVQGDAAISAELSNVDEMSVDVAFSNIKDLNSGRSIPDMTWADLSVLDGSFESHTIEGSFYGPQHEEVAGIFQRNLVVGAFGASR